MAVLTVALGSIWPVLALTGPLLQPGQPGVERSLVWVVAWLLLASWGWLALACAAMAVEALVTGRLHRTTRVAPRLLRLLVVTACGAGVAGSVVGGVVAPAMADSPSSVSELGLLDGLRVPDRVTGAPRALPRPRSAVRTVLVQPGDTLSAIAEDHGTAWTALYARNRLAVGDDPDLIHPGLRLTLPRQTREGTQR